MTESTAKTAASVRIGVLLFPGWQALDAMGPLDALNNLSLHHPLSISLISRNLSPVSTQITDPAENVVSSVFSQSIVPTHTLADASSADFPLDLLIIPGGRGTRKPLPDEVDFVRTKFPQLRYLLTICTGAVVAARAGVLDSRHATSNKAVWKYVTSQRREVSWVAKARWVKDGNVWTASGVSAGIDAALAWIGEVYGEDTAEGIANMMEYIRAKGESDDPFAEMYGCQDVPAH